MTAQQNLKLLFLSAIGVALAACGGGSNDQKGTTDGSDTLDTVAQVGNTNLMKVGGRLFNIPSPVETALLIHKLGLAYQKDVPLPTDKAASFATKTSRSLALGMYGADMAYVTVHNDGQRALSTLQAIEQLGSALDLTNAFDKALIDRYKKNLSSEDSLLRLSGAAYRAADRYLKTNERDDVSALVLAGGWVESMYLTLSDPSSGKEEGVANRVGEQKRTLNDLIALIEQADKEKACSSLIAGLKDLQTAFAAIQVTYQYEPAVTDAANKITHINSTSTVTITPEQLKAISDKVSSLRSTILV
jgi:hypothetical protein